MPLFLYYVGNMKISIPDPYTTSLAVAMYYSVPVRRADDIAVMFEKEKKEKDPRKRIQPSKNIGSNKLMAQRHRKASTTYLCSS